MKPVYLLSTAACALVAVTLLPGCKSSNTVMARVSKITAPEGGKPYVVATEKTAFYRYSPKQASGPDKELPKDTVVNFIRNSFGFSKIQIAGTGEQGFVASDDIMRASPTLLASLAATPPPQLAAAVTSPESAPMETENFDLRSTDASFVPPPETLPPPDLPPDLPAPAAETPAE
jgi:hypothetical protein